MHRTLSQVLKSASNSCSESKINNNTQHKTVPLIVLQLFELENVASRDCCRIVKYDDYQDTLECSFEEEEDSTMEKLLGGVKQSYSFDLLLETKRPEQKFQAYKPGGECICPNKVFHSLRAPDWEKS